MDVARAMAEIRRPDAAGALKWVCLSLGLHLALFFAVAGLATRTTNPQAPVIIDLTFDAGPAVMADKRPLLPPTAAQRPASHIPAPVKVVEKARTSIAAKPVAIAPVPVAPVPAKAVEPMVFAQNVVGKQSPPEGRGAVGVANVFTAGPAAGRVTAGTSEPKAVAGAGAGDAAVAEESRIRYQREHFAYIRDIITKRLIYPYQARKMGWSGRVTLSFVVREDGGAQEIKVVQSSGFPMLDRSAMETVRMVAPFPKPPLRAVIVIPVMFKLM